MMDWMLDWIADHTLVYGVALLVICLLAFGLVQFTQPVQAATPNGCTTIGTVGNVIVAHCVDEENGGSLYANSAGFMVPEP